MLTNVNTSMTVLCVWHIVTPIVNVCLLSVTRVRVSSTNFNFYLLILNFKM